MGSDIVQRQQGMQDKDPGGDGAEYVGMEEIVEDLKFLSSWFLPMKFNQRGL